jgi:hypothetical protein
MMSGGARSSIDGAARFFFSGQKSYPVALAAIIFGCSTYGTNATENDCQKKYGFVTELPDSFKEIASGLVPQPKGSKDPDEFFVNSDGECVCVNRMSPKLHLDFPDTPDGALLTCEPQEKYDEPSRENRTELK